MDAVTRARPVRVLHLGHVSRIPLGQGKAFDAGGVVVAVFRTREGRVLATEAACPHRQGPLADGIVGGTQVVCPLHGFRFDLASGRPVGNDCPALATHDVTVDEDGEMHLALEVG